MMKEDNLECFFRDGRTVILPMDHGIAIPVPGLERPKELVQRVNAFVDGYVMNFGLAVQMLDLVQGKGLCLRTDAYNTRTTGPGAGSTPVYGIDTAEMVGAHAVMNMLYPFSENEAESLQDCADLIHDSVDVEMPVILEALPYGLGQTERYTVDNVRFAVRMASELGADVVKTVYPVNGTVEDFRSIVSESYVPVIVLGGAAMGDDASLFKMVENAMAAGAAGIAIGRNVWQHTQPAAVARSLAALVHEEATALDALGLMKEPVK